MAAPIPSSEAVPLNVWPCGQIPVTQQWTEAGYAPGSEHLAAALFPELARRIVATYSSPDDLVLEPVAGAGVVAIEAAGLRRRAVAVSMLSSHAALVAANAQRVLAQTAAPESVSCLTGDAEDIVAAEIVPRSLGRAALVVASLPRCRPDAPCRTSWDVGAVLDGCRALVSPDGYVVMVIRQTREGSRLLDDGPALVRAADAVGLDYVQHVVALTATVSDSELVAVDRAMTEGDGHAVAHTDVLVFCRREDQAHE